MMTVFFCRHYASEMIVSAPSVMGSAMLMVFFRTNRPIISSFFWGGDTPSLSPTAPDVLQIMETTKTEWKKYISVFLFGSTERW